MNILTSFFISITAFFTGLFTHNVAPLVSNVQQLSIVSTTTQEVVLDTTSTTSPKDSSFVYKNEKYGFTLTFPESWKGYRVKEDNKSIEFGIKDQDLVFLIGIIPKQEWVVMKDDEEKNGGPLPNYIAENEAYVFTYASAQDYAEDVIELAGLRHSIISTFTFVNKQ